MEKIFAPIFKSEEEKIYHVMNDKNPYVFLKSPWKFYDKNLRKYVSIMTVRIHYWCSRKGIEKLIIKWDIKEYVWLCSDKIGKVWYFNI